MRSLDAALYKSICQANEKQDDLGLPPGFIEESIALLKRVLGEEYLGQLLTTKTPVRGLRISSRGSSYRALSFLDSFQVAHETSAHPTDSP